MAVGAHLTSEHAAGDWAWVGPLAAVATHFFVVLSAHQAQEAVSAASSDSSNHDLEMAFAAALQETLRAARQRVAARPPLEAAELRQWFDLWDRRLERGLATPEDASLLFRSDGRPDPTKTFLWPGFEGDLQRWAFEQKEVDTSCTLDISKFPPMLLAELA